MRICILDNDVQILDTISEVLGNAGHVCHRFTEGRTLVRHLQRQSVDLLILEWVLPDMSGEEVLQWVRKHLPPSVLVLFLTSRRRDTDIVSIFDGGADDCVVKPVSPNVFAARVESLLRRKQMRAAVPGTITFGPYTFHTGGAVTMNGNRLPLTRKERDLALMLFQHLNQPVSRDHLLEVVWKADVRFESRTVDTHISVLRKKMQLQPETGFKITTIYGYGYRLESIGESGVIDE